MTNEEKAKKLATQLIGDDRNVQPLIETLVTMAEWKDEQFRMIIERTIDLFGKYSSNAVFTRDNIIEVFKTVRKAMKGE